MSGEQGAGDRHAQGRFQHAAQRLPVAGQTAEEEHQHQGHLGDLIGQIEREELPRAAGEGVDVVVRQQTEQEHQQDAGQAQAGGEVVEQHGHQQQGSEDEQQQREGGTQCQAARRAL